MLEGKDFSGIPSDTLAVLLNKAAVANTGMEKPYRQANGIWPNLHSYRCYR